jgi:hypothetical protein
VVNCFEFNSALRHDLYVPGLFVAETQVIPSEAEFDRIAQRSPADDFNAGAVAKAHLQQPPAKVGIATHGKNATPASNAQLVQAARFRRAAVITRR